MISEPEYDGGDEAAVMDARRRQFFNERAESWLDMWYKNPDTGAFDRFDREFRRLFSMLAISEGDRVLDAGCGSGVLVPYILERIGRGGRLYELDYAENMIEANRRLHPDGRITFISADIMELPVEDDTFDLVICFSCFPHLQDKEAATRRMARALKKNGRLAIAHFLSGDELNKHHSKAPAVMHDRMPPPDDVRAMFTNAGLSMVSFIEQSGFYLALGRKA